MWDFTDGKLVAANKPGVMRTLDAITPGGRNGYLEEKVKELEILGHNGRAITITFKDSVLHTYKDRFLWNAAQDICKRTKGINRYILVPEYSETGRFHLHGVVEAISLVAYGTLQRKLSKQFGITKIKVIDNTVRWAEYCTKQKEKDIWKATEPQDNGQCQERDKSAACSAPGSGPVN